MDKTVVSPVPTVVKMGMSIALLMAPFVCTGSERIKEVST